MYRSIKIAAAVAASVFVAVPSFAQSMGPGLHGQLYVGGSLAAPDWRTDNTNGVSNGDTSGVGGKVYGGYSFNRYFAAELGGVWLGHLKGDGGEAKAEGGYLDAVGTYPINPQWSLLGRVGVIDVKLSTPGGNDSGTNWKYGAGLQYNIDSHTSIRAEAEHYMLNSYNDPHVNLYSLGVNYAF